MSKPVKFGSKDIQRETEESSVGSTTWSYDLVSDVDQKPLSYLDFNEKDDHIPGRFGLIDEMYNIYKQQLDEEKNSAEAKQKIGTIVTKTFDGKKYMGNIVGYDVAKKTFQVVYEEGSSEYIDKEEFDEIVAPPALVEAYLDYIVTRVNDEDTSSGNRRPIFMDYMNKKDKEDEEPKPKKAKTTRRAKAASKSTYVPLAFKEKKKDSYYWY